MTLNIVRATGVPLPAWAVPRQVKTRTHARLHKVLTRENPHVLALQEVDAATAKRIDLGSARVGSPADHGSYLASRAPIVASTTARFHSQGLFRDKGWSSATVLVDGFRSPVQVVSVHLDAFSKRRRREQVEELLSALERQGDALVIVGDFNEDDRPDGAIQRLRDELGLSSMRPSAPTYDFLSIERTLDWILISRHLAFERYEVLPERLSDHRAVAATLREVREISPARVRSA